MEVTNLSYNLLDDHTLIGGATGSGKSTLLKDILFTFEVMGINYNIIDLKQVSLIEYECCVEVYAETKSQAEELLERYILLINQRLAEMKKQRVDKWQGKPYYLVIDECAELIDGSPTIESKLKTILRLGRACGVHVIMAIQSPSRKVIHSDLILNIVNRVALYCDTQIEYKHILKQTNAEPLNTKYGYCYVLTAKDMQPVKYKIYQRSREEIEKVLQPVRKPKKNVMEGYEEYLEKLYAYK